MAGGIPPGARLSTRSIASALGVSAMPVREAMKRLDADGVVHSSAKSGFIVHELSAAEYREILEIRLRMETMLIRKAAVQMTPTEVQQAEWLLSRLLASTEWKQILNYNYKMHFLAYRAARMPYSLSIVENIWLHVGPALHLVQQKARLQPSLDFLSGIVAALRAGDADAAEAALRADIQYNAAALLVVLDEKA